MVRLSLSAYPLGFGVLIFLDLVNGLLPLATTWVTKVILDLLAMSLQSDARTVVASTLVVFPMIFIILELTGRLIMPASAYLNGELQRRLTHRAQDLVYQKINSFVGLAPFEDPSFHDTIQLASHGAQLAPSLSVGTFTAIIRNTVTITSFIVVLVALSPLLAGLAVVASLPQLYSQLRLSHQRFGLAFQNSPKERLVSYYGTLLSRVEHAKEVRLYNLADYFLNTFHSMVEEVHQSQRALQARELAWRAVLAVVTTLAAGGSYIVVVLKAFSGEISLGDVVFYVSAVSSVQGSVSSIILALASMNESVLFFREFEKLLALPQPLPVASEPRPAPALASAIEVQNVSFRYSDQHPWVLRNVNLVIPAGQCVALVGVNGAGKSTLVKLLMRLYDPTEGQILWDGIDIRTFEPSDLRQHIAAIFQDFTRYELTAQTNIGLGNVPFVGDTTMVRQAAREVGVHTMIEGLPEGYGTILSRWLALDGVGTELSGGEWQKIAMARMLMRRADLLIMDEPTAALDAQAEFELYNRFVDLMSGRTGLLITHRFSTVRMADVAAVLEDGQITEYGTHEQLMLQGGTYARLYSMQAERYR